MEGAYLPVLYCQLPCRQEHQQTRLSFASAAGSRRFRLQYYPLFFITPNKFETSAQFNETTANYFGKPTETLQFCGQLFNIIKI
jgi:hypothetical protein